MSIALNERKNSFSVEKTVNLGLPHDTAEKAEYINNSKPKICMVVLIMQIKTSSTEQITYTEIEKKP